MKKIINNFSKNKFKPTIYWTYTDEAPALASYNLFPILNKFVNKHVNLRMIDISLSNRILSEFNQSNNDGLKKLKYLVKKPDSNIIKLPNVSASVPQLINAINELNDKDYNIPDYNKEIKKYDKILGSAVNPILREGNSYRKVPLSVKKYVKHNPHKLGDWKSDSKTKVASMTKGDFYENEKSLQIMKNDKLKIILTDEKNTLILKTDILVEKNDLLDTSYMSINELRKFYKFTFEKAKNENLIISLHLKSTMMKVSDPILFGEAIESYFGEEFKNKDLNAQNGLNNLYQNEQLKKILEEKLDSYCKIYYTDPDNKISNFHFPSNVIIDASMPMIMRDSGKLTDRDNNLDDTIAIIPDRCYSNIYQKMIDNFKKHGKLEVNSMGSFSNIGLMANKAEEYGSHDKTFQVPFKGMVKVIDQNDNILASHSVDKNDIWRMCITKDIAINNWIELAYEASKNDKIIFWLDDKRSHDKIIINKIKSTDILNDNILILNLEDAMEESINTLRNGKNIISVTGNVLRDYLTDLFPILELGTSSKMLSKVNLLSGGVLYETGAGGTAPKHVEQFINTGHLRWDSLGEYLALAESLHDCSKQYSNVDIYILADTLKTSIEKILDNDKLPKKISGQLSNMHTNYYLSLYWSEELSNYDNNYRVLYNKLKEKESKILDELKIENEQNLELGGYWIYDNIKLNKYLLPSRTFNQILDI